VNHAPLADAPAATANETGRPAHANTDSGPAISTTATSPSIAIDDAELTRKAASLRDRLEALPSLIVAYSGGVDSAYLAYAASRVLGSRVSCITADSPSYPDRHRQLAIRIARECGFRHELIRTGELERPEYRANPANRCYFCKHELYTQLTAIARARGIAAIADGSNADDRGDYRPGRQAAREFGIVSPLDEAGLTKAEIRELSRRAGLPTWDEPASACLSSRIPYFSEVTDEKLRMIERAEAVLRELGFRICRVRHHETLARIELGQDEIARALEPGVSSAIDRELRALGYQHVTVDLRGYRLGSLNDALRLRPV
jgi:pyridinium-3,5-biscarboxylic acid mononucleotide sulfurtransferase